MLHVFALGPVVTQKEDDFHLVVSMGEGAPLFEVGPDRMALLRKLVRGGGAQGYLFEPDLEAEAAALGVQVAALPEDLVGLKAALAISMEHGGSLGGPENMDAVLELMVAAVRFDAAAPWEVFSSGEPIDVKVRGAFDGSFEASVLGAEDEYGLALYYDRGAIAQVEAFVSQNRHDEVMSLQCLSCTLMDEPAFVAEAVGAATGLDVVPVVMKIRRGDLHPPTKPELAALIASLHAVAELAESEGASRSGKGVSTSVKKTEATATPRADSGIPIGRGSLEEQAEPLAPSFEGVGRNAPCPCGSGMKFKKCHLGKAPRESSGVPSGGSSFPPGSSRWHPIDQQLVSRLLAFAERRLGKNALEAAGRALFGDRERFLELHVPFALYEHPSFPDGRSVGRVFLDEEGDTLDADLRTVLEAQLSSRVTMFEVLETRPGEGMSLLDLFSGRRHEVKEVSASRSIPVRAALVGRLLSIAREDVLSGIHGRTFGPARVDAILARLGRAGVDPSVSPGAPPDAAKLLEEWDAEISAEAIELASPNIMTNTDGDPLVFVEETFSIARGARDELVDKLSGLEHVQLDVDTEKLTELTFVKPGNAMHSTWTSTVHGSARITKAQLVLSTNSDARADALKARIEGAGAGLLTSKKRVRTLPPQSRGGRTVAVDAQPVALRKNDVSAREDVLREARRDWIDEALPALGGRSMREAVKDPAQRWAVHRVLCDQEFLTSSQGEPGGLQETRALRRALGLNTLGQVDATQQVDLALGAGRKISECVLDVAKPLIEASIGRGHAATETVVGIGIALWNAAVLDAQQPGSSEVARLRGKLVREKAPREVLELIDEVLSRRARRHSDDLRMVGNWELKQVKGGFTLLAEARVDQPLIDRARELGITPAPFHR